MNRGSHMVRDGCELEGALDNWCSVTESVAGIAIDKEWLGSKKMERRFSARGLSWPFCGLPRNARLKSEEVRIGKKALGLGGVVEQPTPSRSGIASGTCQIIGGLLKRAGLKMRANVVKAEFGTVGWRSGCPCVLKCAFAGHAQSFELVRREPGLLHTDHGGLTLRVESTARPYHTLTPTVLSFLCKEELSEKLHVLFAGGLAKMAMQAAHLRLGRRGRRARWAKTSLIEKNPLKRCRIFLCLVSISRNCLPILYGRNSTAVQTHTIAS